MEKARILGMGLGILAMAACSGKDSTTAPMPTQETWCLHQGEFVGILTISIDGGIISGDMDWSNYSDATVSGSTANQGKDSTLYDMQFEYSPSLEGIYKGTRRKGTNQMSGLTHALVNGSPDGNGNFSWSATMGACTD